LGIASSVYVKPAEPVSAPGFRACQFLIAGDASLGRICRVPGRHGKAN
jgi:hypothetical protein